MPPAARTDLSAQELLDQRRLQNTLAQRRRRERLREITDASKGSIKSSKQPRQKRNKPGHRSDGKDEFDSAGNLMTVIPITSDKSAQRNMFPVTTLMDGSSSELSIISTSDSIKSSSSIDTSSSPADTDLLEFDLSCGLPLTDCTSLTAVVKNDSSLAPRYPSGDEATDPFLDLTRLIEQIVHSSQDTNYITRESMMSAYRLIQQCTTSFNNLMSLTIPSLTAIHAYRLNYERIGLKADLMESYDVKSPIADSWVLYEMSKTGKLLKPSTIDNHGTISSRIRLHWDKVPENMYPTRLQLSMQHHPMVDVSFPWPLVRDRFLLSTSNGSLDEAEFCADLLQHPYTTGQSQPFIIWGNDPMDIENWELSESFAKKYHFLFDEEIIRRTNWWRKKRDLAPISILT